MQTLPAMHRRLRLHMPSGSPLSSTLAGRSWTQQPMTPKNPRSSRDAPARRDEPETASSGADASRARCA